MTAPRSKRRAISPVGLDPGIESVVRSGTIGLTGRRLEAIQIVSRIGTNRDQEGRTRTADASATPTPKAMICDRRDVDSTGFVQIAAIPQSDINIRGTKTASERMSGEREIV
jgi:hypothetical protein